MEENYSDLRRRHIDYALNGKVMLCTGIVLFFALLVVLCFHNYARVFLRNRSRRYLRRHRAQGLLSGSAASHATNVNAAASKGLDPSVVKTIPTVIYSANAKDTHLFPPLECAVCLSEFQNDEEARVLPKCHHTFHVDCIDMWFHTHSSCPLCRAPVQVDITAVVNPPHLSQRSELSTVQSAEPAGSEPPGPGEEDLVIEINYNISSAAPASSSSAAASPSSLKLERCPMKTLELVELEILVEVPTATGPGLDDRLITGDDADMGSGSGNRIPGLKRMWSV